MNAKKLIEEKKEIFKNAKIWAEKEIKNHYESVEDGSIEKIDKMFIEELKNCNTWEEAEDIANKYII